MIEQLFKQENIPAIASDLQRYGKRYTSWSNLLHMEDIDIVTNDIDSFAENANLERTDMFGEDEVVKIVDAIRKVHDEMTKIVINIKKGLAQLYENGLIDRKNVDVFLRELDEHINVNFLDNKERDQINRLIELIKEFKDMHSKWVIKENEVKEFIKELKSIGASKRDSGALRSSFPSDPGKSNKGQRGEGGWGSRSSRRRL